MTESHRSFAPVTDADLERLSKIVSTAHRDLRRIRPDLAGRLVAGCLAQGAAAHRVDEMTGVKDFDLWLFYRLDEDSQPANARRRKTYDFGVSAHGRHPDDDGSKFVGRRVDVMCRSLPPGAPADPVDAVEAWLAGGAASPTILSKRPVVLVWPKPLLGHSVRPVDR